MIHWLVVSWGITGSHTSYWFGLDLVSKKGGKEGWGKEIFTGFVEVEGVIGFKMTGPASFFLRW